MCFMSLQGHKILCPYRVQRIKAFIRNLYLYAFAMMSSTKTKELAETIQLYYFSKSVAVGDDRVWVNEKEDVEV
jgi:hypothetical protein